MKRIPESYKSAPVDSYAREIAVCRCGGTLHFDTDHEFGYTIETCDRCKVTRPMQRAPRREELDPMPVAGEPKPHRFESIECDRCPTVILWERGRGSRPKRCPDCRDEKQREESREYQRKRASKRRAA